MSNLIYHQPEPARPQDVTSALEQGDNSAARHSLVGAAFYHPDWRAVQDLCLQLLDNPDKQTAGLAATCLGHLARIHGQLDLDKVLPALHLHQSDTAVAGRIESALEDIEMYITETE